MVEKSADPRIWKLLVAIFNVAGASLVLLEVGYLFAFLLFDVQYVYPWMQPAVSITAAVCFVISLICCTKYTPKKTVEKKAIALFLILSFLIVLGFVQNEKIMEVYRSPDGSKTVMLTRSVSEDYAVTAYQSFGVPFLVKKDQAVELPFGEYARADWLTSETFTLTFYDANHEIQQYLGLFGEDQRDSSRQIESLLGGTWQGEGLKVVSDTRRFHVTYEGIERKTGICWTAGNDVLQFFADTNIDNHPIWTLAVGDGWAFSKDGSITQTGTIIARKVNMEDEAIVLNQVDSTIPDLSREEDNIAAVSSDPGLEESIPVDDGLGVVCSSSDPFEIFVAMIEQNASYHLGDDSASYTMSDITLTLIAGDSREFVMDIDATMIFIDSKHGWNMIKRFHVTPKQNGNYDFQKMATDWDWREGNRVNISPLVDEPQTKKLDQTYTVDVQRS